MASTKMFSLEGKGLRLDSAADLEPHVGPLRDSSEVEEIRLGGNTLGVEAANALANILESKKSLRIANFADIFTSRLLNEIPPALSSLLTALLTLPHLHTVNLSDNAFGLNTQAPLVAFLSHHVPLRHLILNNNGLGPKAGVFIADALVDLHTKKDDARKTGIEVPNLETIICGRNRLENGSMEAWAKAFAAHRGVLEVKMVQNGIRQEGITHLLKEGLRHAVALKVLDLQDNTFTIMGARALTEVVTGWENLQELGVGDCLLGARGGVVLAEALAKGKNTSLQTLRMQYNDIDAKGLGALSVSAKLALPALRRVEVNGNKFAEEDPSVDALRSLLDDRREEAGEDEGDEWGLDELDDLEEESDDEDEEEDEEDEEDELKAEKTLREMDQAEEADVPERKDSEVDKLAEALSKKLET